MKRVKTQAGLRQSLLLAGLMLASAGAQAALPTLTITGVVGNSLDRIDGYAGGFAYDTSAWFGKAYTLELSPDIALVAKQNYPIDFDPSVSENVWEPANVTYRLSIDGVLVFSGIDTQFSEVVTINDITPPAGLPDSTELPPGVIADGTHTYDDLFISSSGINLGCFDGGTNGVCDGNDAVGSEEIYEYGVLNFEQFWEVTPTSDMIPDTNQPNLPALDFTQGFNLASFQIGHYSTDTQTGTQIASLELSVVSVTVTPVPEPETYAMLLAGLGLVGFAVRRRSV